MTELSIIAAIDEVGGLGANKMLLAHLPADLAHFKKLTVGKPIIMGRATYESIGRPLPNRTNIVISTTLQKVPGIIVCTSLDNAIKHAVKSDSEIMIIGGAQVYAQAIKLVSRMYITKIHHKFTADVFFPEIRQEIWCPVVETLRYKDETNKYDMTFTTYERKSAPLFKS